MIVIELVIFVVDFKDLFGTTMLNFDSFYLGDSSYYLLFLRFSVCKSGL